MLARHGGREEPRVVAGSCCCNGRSSGRPIGKERETGEAGARDGSPHGKTGKERWGERRGKQQSKPQKNEDKETMMIVSRPRIVLATMGDSSASRRRRARYAPGAIGVCGERCEARGQ